MKELIYIVEDEPDIAALVQLHLEKTGFRHRWFQTAKAFFNGIEKSHPDLVILDLMLEDMDGLEICKNLRNDEKKKNIPIIMLTARAEEIDKILGLELGADDYVTKPFSPKELIARIKAILRRSQKQGTNSEIIVRIGEILAIDSEKFQVSVRGENIDLTTTEFKILEILSNHPGWVFSREKILDHIWGYDKAVIDRTVDVHIRHLREKLGDAGAFIKNIRGIGYKLEI
ncbi:MAG: response regulator transcription factor [Spirochaetia bacterium]|nr:response regulator transcription factor [Spirochaetia bacterium]